MGCSQSTKVEKTKLDKPVEVPITKELFVKFIDLDKQIKGFENENIVKNFELKVNEIDSLKKKVNELTNQNESLKAKSEKEKADVKNLQSVKEAMEKKDFQTEFDREQEEYLAALNKVELCSKELESTKELLSSKEKEISELEGKVKKVQAAYKEQDDLLTSIFGGDYGSDLENQLEAELDLLLERKQRIAAAKMRWEAAMKFEQDASARLIVACKKWAQLNENTSQSHAYQIATDARNELVETTQAMTAAQQYLSNIEFPYCNADEVSTLKKATRYIYTDMLTKDRQDHAMEVYSKTQKRLEALILWMKHVIDKTISGDFERASREVRVTEGKLRDERVRLMRTKLEEQGENMDDKAFHVDPSEQPDSDIDDRKPDPAKPEEQDLAPTPTNEQLFGNIEELKRQHEEEMAEFGKAQQMNKERMTQGLHEKLAQRKGRRKHARAQIG